jgi:nucleotide-binding universal stress UspA family protein
MPFPCILVPVDLSDDNRRAVEIAAELASRHSDGRLVLLHVIETIDDEPEDEASDFYGPIEERARKLMEELVDALGPEMPDSASSAALPAAEHAAAGAAGARKPRVIERRVAYGHRLAEVLAAAADCGAALIVLRSHRVEPGRQGAGLGTLSHEIALLAEAPVLLVK